jgi:hypothetical protein
MNFGNAGHIEIGKLFESARLKTELDSDARSHIQHCTVCQDRFGWMQTAAELAASEVEHEPPQALVDSVLRFGQPQLLRKIRNFIVASLTFDSLTSATPVGVRRTENASREMTYQAEDLEIALSLRRSANGKMTLTGQVLGQDSPMDDTSARADLVLDGDHFATSPLTNWGEFAFQDVPEGPCGLRIQIAGRTISVPTLQ